MIRANALMPAARFGLREEMKQAYGFGWREHVRGVTTTLDVVENLAFHERIRAQLAKLDAQYQAQDRRRLHARPGQGAARRCRSQDARRDRRRGQRPRRDRALFRGRRDRLLLRLAGARADPASGYYDALREGRMIASTGKILAAIGIANAQRDRPDTLYLDRAAPAHGGLESCDKGAGGTARGRRAIVAFACSLNVPLEWRAAQLGQARMRRLIDRFGFNLPPARSAEEATPPSTAAVRGLIAGSPRRVHQMAAVVLASLTEQGHRPVRPPTLVKAYDFTSARPPPAPLGVRQHRAEPADRRPRPAAAQDAAAGAAVLLATPACSTAP